MHVSRHPHAFAFALALAATPPLAAQAPVQSDTASKSEKITPVSDNSFLIEEAYNQEAGVVQHIFTFRRSPGGAWGNSFTQEWPAPSMRHQLSYTIPVASGGGSRASIGDVLLNYRYQLRGSDEERVWIAPRASVVLPTGSVAEGQGAGGVGLQLLVPMSVTISEQLVTHFNAGTTITHARSVDGTRRTTVGYLGGASAIYLLAPTLNLMLEGLWERPEQLDDSGNATAENHFTLVPGVRGAINFANGLQIVPGVGVPIALGSSGGTRDLLLYLSFEHRFR
jgi:hypothetical protein